MADHAPKLLTTCVCEDALAGLTNRLTLYNLFRERAAAAWPAVVPHLVVANVWLREDPSTSSGQGPSTSRRGELVEPSGQAGLRSGGDGNDGVFTERVVLLSPDRQTTMADASSMLTFGNSRFCVQVSRFTGVVLPAPGTYSIQIWLERQQVAEYPLIVIDESGEPVSEGSVEGPVLSSS